MAVTEQRRLEIQKRMDELRMPGSPYFDNHDFRHKHAVEEMTRLYQELSGTEPVRYKGASSV